MLRRELGGELCTVGGMLGEELCTVGREFRAREGNFWLYTGLCVTHS